MTRTIGKSWSGKCGTYKRSRSKDDRGRRASLSVVLPGSKEKRLLEAHQSQAIERRLRQAKEVPNGNPAEGNVGGVIGPERCVLTHPNSSSLAKVSRVPRGELQITTLLFGLSTSPRVFIRVAGAVVAELRRHVVPLFVYLDLVLGDSLKQAEASVGATITLLQQIGWVINWEKSHPTPTQALVYLGALLDLERGRAFPSQERCSSLKGAITQLLADPWSPAWSLLSLSVTTDASLFGWGAFCESRTLAGVWSAEEAELHINMLQLEAVVRAVRALRNHAQGTSLTVFSNNTTVVAYINRLGGTRSPQLCLKVCSFLLWCHRHDIVVRASHVAGKDNTLADALSRGCASGN